MGLTFVRLADAFEVHTSANIAEEAWHWTFPSDATPGPAIFELDQQAMPRSRTLPANHQAPTGSGKSTQVPQILLDHGCSDGQIVMQPRRLATRLLAARVASSEIAGSARKSGIKFVSTLHRIARIRL
jgi:hypothetical protein